MFGYFRYFPDNDTWSHAFLRCVNSGGLLGEMDRAGRRLQEAAAKPPSGDLEAWHTEWYRLGEQVEAIASTAVEAQACCEEAGSQHKELRVYTYETGGALHCQVDCAEPAAGGMADWLAERL